MSLRRKRKRKLRNMYRIEMDNIIEAIKDNTMHNIPYILSQYRRLYKFKKLYLAYNTDINHIRHAEKYNSICCYYVNR